MSLVAPVGDGGKHSGKFYGTCFYCSVQACGSSGMYTRLWNFVRFHRLGKTPKRCNYQARLAWEVTLLVARPRPLAQDMGKWIVNEGNNRTPTTAEIINIFSASTDFGPPIDLSLAGRLPACSGLAKWTTRGISVKAGLTDCSWFSDNTIHVKKKPRWWW